MASVRNETKMNIGIAIGIGVRCKKQHWTSSIYILKSGAIWYKRERNSALGYFKLWYSSDSGATWGDDALVTLDLTEDSPLIDTAHVNTHQIVGTSYEVVKNGEILYNT